MTKVVSGAVTGAALIVALPAVAQTANAMGDWYGLHWGMSPSQVVKALSEKPEVANAHCGTEEECWPAVANHSIGTPIIGSIMLNGAYCPTTLDFNNHNGLSGVSIIRSGTGLTDAWIASIEATLAAKYGEAVQVISSNPRPWIAETKYEWLSKRSDIELKVQHWDGGISATFLTYKSIDQSLAAKL
jgi:hypothetical protein